MATLSVVNHNVLLAFGGRDSNKQYSDKILEFNWGMHRTTTLNINTLIEHNKNEIIRVLKDQLIAAINDEEFLSQLDTLLGMLAQ